MKYQNFLNALILFLGASFLALQVEADSGGLGVAGNVTTASDGSTTVDFSQPSSSTRAGTDYTLYCFSPTLWINIQGVNGTLLYTQKLTDKISTVKINPSAAEVEWLFQIGGVCNENTKWTGKWYQTAIDRCWTDMTIANGRLQCTGLSSTRQPYVDVGAQLEEVPADKLCDHVTSEFKNSGAKCVLPTP